MQHFPRSELCPKSAELHLMAIYPYSDVFVNNNNNMGCGSVGGHKRDD